jgi:hypothetical protein
VITLTHVEGTRLYQAERSTDPGFLTYYVSDPDVKQADLPPTLSIDSEWWSKSTLCGYFLILALEPADISVFAGVAAEYGFGVPLHASFAWVQYQETPTPKITAVYQLDLKPDETNTNIVIARGATIRFGTYGLPFMPNGVVRPVSVGGDAIERFSFGYPLQYPAGRPPDLPPDIPPPDGTGVNLPLVGPQRYVLQSLSLVGDFSNDSGQGMDVGFRYSYAQDGKTVSQFYPIFANSSGSQVEFLVNWDPLAPLNPQRSWMKFTGNTYKVTVTAEGQGKIEVDQSGSVLPSWFRTIYGQPLWLRPVLTGDHAAQLVMQPRPPDSPGETAYYMVPSGDYEVLAEGRDSGRPFPAQMHLLCGLAGTESIGFPPGTFATPLTTIRFHPWKAAFAPVFPLTNAADGLAASGAHRFGTFADAPLLDETWPTAWISVAPTRTGVKTVYYSQPEQAALYDAKQGARAPYILELFQAPVAEFTSAALDKSYPVAIYAGLEAPGTRAGFPPDKVRDFETQILNRFRKEKISIIPSEPTPATEAVPTTTPQGLITQLRGMIWDSVLLAQNKEDGSKLEFRNLGDDLREALQSNQMFLVASLAAPLGTFAHNITIAGWPFDIDVSSGADLDEDYGNILIFKFGRGAIKDLVTDPKSWTNATTFNKDPSRMSVFLQNYITNAETSAEDNHRFEKFVNLVSNPAWEGILALRVTVGLQQFPAELKGLLAGINLDRFDAHHFGIETSFVKSNNGLEQEKSSLFGLISYIDTDYRTHQSIRALSKTDRLITHVQQTVEIDPQRDFYDFKVLQLEVVFENSELLDFTSKIQLTTTKWFGESASLQSGYPPNPINNQAIDLNGSYEMHNGRRSYSFYTDPAQTYKFLISSQVLNYVQIVKAQFETLRSEPQSDRSENIFTRFSFWGYLNFKEQPVFDLFSFGSQANPQLSEKQGLYFANLGLTMNFTLRPDNTTTGRKFAFDAGQASYDISQSEVRVNSLFNRFPLKITSILQSDGRGTPADLGYLSVRPPKGFRALRLSKDWYAINFELNLGSMGSLAEKAGFSAGLLLAWSPSESTVRAEVQIKLPGTGGGKKLLSLQGVLKLSIQFFEFTMLPLKGTEDLQYQLYFRNAGLSVLGMKLPTEGRMDMVLAGDPERKLEAGSLSWMAAYYREEKQALVAQRLLKGFRAEPRPRAQPNLHGDG